MFPSCATAALQNRDILLAAEKQSTIAVKDNLRCVPSSGVQLIEGLARINIHPLLSSALECVLETYSSPQMLGSHIPTKEYIQLTIINSSGTEKQKYGFNKPYFLLFRPRDHIGDIR